ncbi:MAG: ATP-binding cassette domain-containing protein, partial [Pseudomonadota bacterium]
LSDILAKRAELDQRRYDFIGETLGGIEAIKSMAMEPQMERRLERLQKQSAAVAFRKNLLSNDLTTTTSFMIGIMMVAVVTIGAMMVLNGDLSVGTLACTTLLVSRLAQLVVRCIPVLMERQTAQFSRERASSLFEPAQEDATASDFNVEISGRVRLKDVEFSYDDAAGPQIVIDDLDIKPGEAVGIKGGSSTGKSTLLKILAGELVVQRGTVEIDGHDIHGELKSQLQSQMRFIRNVPQMFRGSILENITMFEKGKVVLKAKEMARIIGLDQAVNQLPGGINTEIGSGASTVLPIGMLQQISVARALTADPKILLFDEANTALDLRADQILIEQLARLNGRMTRIYITNRPSLLKTADRTFELQNGRLVPLTPKN